MCRVPASIHAATARGIRGIETRADAETDPRTAARGGRSMSTDEHLEFLSTGTMKRMRECGTCTIDYLYGQ